MFTAVTKQGSRNGKTAKSPAGSNREGYCVAGIESSPPAAGATINPTLRSPGAPNQHFEVLCMSW